MNDGFQFLEIIFFAIVAAFLVLRLRAVLGKRTGAEPPPRPSRWIAEAPPPPATVVDLATVRRSAAEPPAETPVAQGLAAIRAADPAFDLDGFLGGAKAAFEMIVGAFAAGDKATLRPLLAPEVFRQFSDAIDIRARNGEVLTTELVNIRSVELVEAGLENRVAALTLKITSEQVNALTSHDGQIIEGSADRVVDVIDLWSFRRDTRSSDPNWQLAATATPEG